MKKIYIDNDFYDLNLSRRSKSELCLYLYTFIILLLERGSYKGAQKDIWEALRVVLSPIQIPKVRTLKKIAPRSNRLKKGIIKKSKLKKKVFELILDIGLFEANLFDTHTFSNPTRSFIEFDFSEINNIMYLSLKNAANCTTKIRLRFVKPIIKKPGKIYFHLIYKLNQYCSKKIAIDFIIAITKHSLSRTTYSKWLKEKVINDEELNEQKEISKKKKLSELLEKENNQPLKDDKILENIGFSNDIKELIHDRGKKNHLFYFKTESDHFVYLRESITNKTIELFYLTLEQPEKKIFKSMNQSNEYLLRIERQQNNIVWGRLILSIKHSSVHPISNNRQYIKNEKTRLLKLKTIEKTEKKIV